MMGILDYMDKNYTADTAGQGQLTIYCNNETVVNAMNEWSQSKVTSKAKNVDMISACLRMRDRIPIPIQCKHIYGHQDEAAAFDTLTPEAQKNVVMDGLAKELVDTLERRETQLPTHCDHPDSIATCRRKSTVFTQTYNNSIYNHIYKDKIQTYWNDKKRIHKDDNHLIDYQSIEKGTKSLSLNMKRFVAKWTSQCIGTGKNMKQWQMRYDDYCPSCTQPDKDTTHIPTCQHQDALDSWKHAFKHFIEALVKQDTCPILLKAMKYDIMAWRYGQLTQSLDTYPTTIKRIILEQQRLGWDLFFEGVITKTFGTYMTNYYKRHRSLKTGSSWAGKVYEESWKFIFQLWTARNKQLHETKRIADLEGMQAVRNVIRNEYGKGIGRLPASDFLHMFRN